MEVRLYESLVIHCDVSIPFHHAVDDVQLVQSIAVGAGLAWAFSLDGAPETAAPAKNSHHSHAGHEHP
ncbi:MAG: hypothetical protein ACI9MR_004883 [Myxococcota bacterium]|jgi:hypothetical protein